jgi:hypothetical protein
MTIPICPWISILNFREKKIIEKPLYISFRKIFFKGNEVILFF